MSTYTEYNKAYYEKKKAEKESKEYKTLAAIRSLLNNARSRAIRKGFDFNIEESDIVLPELCPYLKVKLVTKFDKGTTQWEEYKATLDRIDSTKGYVKGNVEVISLLANKMKNNSTKEQLVTFAKSVLDKELDL